MLRLTIFAALITVLTACAQGQNPPQDAYALNKEYQALAAVELGYLKSGYANPTSACAVKTADNIAFGYVTQATQQAKDWNAASVDDKPAELTLFERLEALARSALDNVTSIMDVIKTGGETSCPSQPS
jgi:hypothetical protein